MDDFDDTSSKQSAVDELDTYIENRQQKSSPRDDLEDIRSAMARCVAESSFFIISFTKRWRVSFLHRPSRLSSTYTTPFFRRLFSSIDVVDEASFDAFTGRTKQKSKQPFSSSQQHYLPDNKATAHFDPSTFNDEEDPFSSLPSGPTPPLPSTRWRGLSKGAAQSFYNSDAAPSNFADPEDSDDPFSAPSPPVFPPNLSSYIHPSASSSNRSVLSSMRALQDKIRKLESEKSAALSQCHELQSLGSRDHLDTSSVRESEARASASEKTRRGVLLDRCAAEKGAVEAKVERLAVRTETANAELEEGRRETAALRKERDTVFGRLEELSAENEKLEQEIRALQRDEKKLSVEITDEQERAKVEERRVVEEIAKVRQQLQCKGSFGSRLTLRCFWPACLPPPHVRSSRPSSRSNSPGEPPPPPARPSSTRSSPWS